MQPTKQNGARAKILRTLGSEGMMTVNELAESSGLTASQARIAPEDQGSRAAADTSGDDKASTDYVQAETPISVDAIDATEPAPPPEQYAICRAGQGHLSAWPLRDMTIDEARQLAIDDAAAIGGEVVLYRCVPIGKAFPRIVFEEAS